MRSRRRSGYLCQECGGESVQWLGRCPHCGRYGTMVEAPPAPARNTATWLADLAQGPQELSQVPLGEAPRIPLPYREVARVLGGGLVPGSLVLVAGEPGIGKSTLLLQLASALATLGRVAYVSGEESAQQVRMRAQRLGLEGRGVFLLSETCVESVLQALEGLSPALAVVDSVQTLYSEAVPSSPGSVAQVRESTRLLMRWAKGRRVPVLLAGHVTKEGDVAGPRVLEHMVDAVLYLEGESLGSYRLLRAAKNRFGSTNEVAVLEMRGQGLVEVPDPSRALLAGWRAGVPGSVVAAVVEGTRPLLVEVQALTSPSGLATPRRTANGLDPNRLVMLSAVLSQRVRLPLAGQDILVNVAGGLRVMEPSADLAMALAIASSLRHTPLPRGMVVVGEVGLTGEVRAVPLLEQRLREASRLGFSLALVPAPSASDLHPPEGLEVRPAGTVVEAIRMALPRDGRQAP